MIRLIVIITYKNHQHRQYHHQYHQIFPWPSSPPSSCSAPHTRNQARATESRPPRSQQHPSSREQKG
ncbi:uncharacterized protein K452DRAFT_31173 [Aplosporella prunicola CBS 121167]|uniref:Uncharacterized protein n=1 Tax=Aplosporella prunicola CBS 121167 TaxID=1176127 RepID=A0A6A6BE18_9PEZI|nr:uncharacterized protein K452DRAFT_31173 [Aplosporella prunicola CBS 121167]KAF2141623.1 hypothetical protein K452DRAFT_31173 [Aplosporella prunicola CBS 121167]